MRTKLGGSRQATSVLIASVLLSACAAGTYPFPGGSYPGNPQSYATQSSQGSQFAQTVAVPTLLGGAAGAGLGALVCPKNRATCAVGGGAAGGLLGGAAGYYVAGKNQQASNREQELSSRIQAAQEQTVYFQRIIDDTNENIAQYREDIRALQSQYHTGQVIHARNQQEENKLQNNISVLQNSIHSINQTITKINIDLQKFAGADTGKLSEEQDELIHQRDTMQKQLDALNGRKARVA